MADTTLDTTTLTVRLKFFEPPPRSTAIGDFVQLLQDVNDLMTFASLLTIDSLNPPGPYARPPGDDLYPEDPSSEASLLNTASLIASRFLIARLTYQSPIEIDLVFALGSGGILAFGSVAAWKLPDLWAKVSHARSQHHKANSDREIFRLLQDEMAHIRRVRNTQRHIAPDEDASLAVDQLLSRAFAALEKAEEIRVEQSQASCCQIGSAQGAEALT